MDLELRPGKICSMTTSKLEQTLPLGARTRRWAGWLLSGLAILFLIMDSFIKLVPIPEVVQTMGQLGYATNEPFLRGLGVVTLVCTILYAFPRTSVWGAVLLTGLFGGAIATHLRVESPWFSHTLFGVYLGVMVWTGLWLRQDKVCGVFFHAR